MWGVRHMLILSLCPCSQRFDSRSQLGNTWNRCSKCLILGAVHTSYTPPFTLIVKLEQKVFSIWFCTYCYLFSKCYNKILRLVYYFNYWFLMGNPYDNPFQDYTASNPVNMIYILVMCLVLKSPVWVIQQTGSVILFYYFGCFITYLW